MIFLYHIIRLFWFVIMEEIFLNSVNGSTIVRSISNSRNIESKKKEYKLKKVVIGTYR